MEIVKRLESAKFARVLNEASGTIIPSGQSIVFKHTREHPNNMFHGIRGIQGTLPNKPDVRGVYLNTELEDVELELVAVHELCHIIAENQGFHYKYALTSKVSNKQLDLWEALAVSIAQCFTHLTVYRLTKNHGYDITGFDDCILGDIRKNIDQGKHAGTSAVAQNAILHMSNIYQGRNSLSTLDIHELELLFEKWDGRIMELSRKTQPAIPDVDLFEVAECFEATIALRNTIGQGLEIDMSKCIHLFNPDTDEPE